MSSFGDSDADKFYEVEADIIVKQQFMVYMHSTVKKKIEFLTMEYVRPIFLYSFLFLPCLILIIQ